MPFPPKPVRAFLAQAYPHKPWLWDHPIRFLSRRAILAMLERAAPNSLDAQWVLPLIPDERIVYSLRDIMGRAIFLHGCTEYGTAHLMQKLIEPDWVCVDIGANRGEYTVIMARHASRGHVYAFEPVDPIYERLGANVQLNRLDNVTTAHKAIHRYDGMCSFFVNPYRGNSGLSSLSPSEYYAGEGLEEREVPCVTLDVALESIKKIDLLKIDVEGHEIDVLQGAEHILDSLQPTVIFEFGLPGRFAPTLAADHLVARGYALYGIRYDTKVGATLFPVDITRPDSTAEIHSPYEPTNLVAIHARNSHLSDRLVQS